MRVSIRVKQGSSRTRVGGRHGDDLVVAVTARAVDGQATRAALDALADALGCRPREVRLITGATSRTKVVEVPDRCAALLDELTGTDSRAEYEADQ